MIEKYIRKGLPQGDPFPVADGKYRAKMDQNESPMDLPKNLKNAILNDLKSNHWNRYPQPIDYEHAKKTIASVLNISSEMMAITLGCDEVIQGVHFLAGGPDRTAAVFQPTYPMLAHAGIMASTPVSEFMAGPEYNVRTEYFRDKHLILIANPNNPTGQLTDNIILKEALKSRAFVFIDEAYFDYSGKTCISWLDQNQNLGIGRSLSKSMLAGMRMGIFIAHPMVIRSFESLVTAPYNISIIHLIIAKYFAEIQAVVKENAQKIIKARDYLINEMKKIEVKVYPSATNFILFKINNSNRIFSDLLQMGIRIRDMSSINGLENHLRVTVGNPTENKLFINALKNIVIST